VAESSSKLFRNQLVALRKERGWTQEKAAESAGVGYKTYQHLELGVRDNPTLKILEKLAEGFGVEIGALRGQSTS
jgi:transcriptional regulator with XRE-family HTH domain